MKLVVTEKNIAAQKIADLLGVGKPKADKVYSTPVYRFERDGEEWVTIGLRGHILEPNFVPALTYKKRGGWIGVDANGEMIPADLPTDLPKPPFKKKKPFVPDGVELNAWKMDALPYLIYAPIEKLPKEKDIIRSLKNLAKKADSIVIATDFDREGELIGSDALTCIREVNEEAPVSRARYSAITKEEITRAFTNLVELDVDLAQAGASRQDIDLIWGAVLTRYLTLVKFAGYGNVRSSGRVQTPTLALIVARERERLAFVPEDYWVIKGDFSHKDLEFSANHATARFKVESEADQVMEHVAGATSARVAAIEKKQRKQAAPVPFNTTSLMAAASAEGLTPARTMRLAESLYMDGFISYPRVDNTVYPSSLDLRDILKRISGNPAYRPFAEELLKKCPEFDYILTPEAKSIPLAYEMSRQSGKKYFVARKKPKVYMTDPVCVSVRSITTDAEQTLLLGREDGDQLRGKKVLIVDDVISTGESLAAVVALADKFDANIVAKAAVLAEGDAAERDDIVFLEKLPLFFK